MPPGVKRSAAGRPVIGERKKTKWDRKRQELDECVFTLNHTVEGRYRDGEANYDEVGVLLITWADDDLYGDLPGAEEREVPRLRDIFQHELGFCTETIEVPSERSASALLLEVANFAHRYDGPNKLAIVYYAGHGAVEDERLKLYAKQAADKDGNPTTFFDEAIISPLKTPQTDILVITDCCFAAQAFSKVELGLRKFELLAATAHDKRARPPGPDSFTTHLCQALTDLAKGPKGFSTSKLYRRIYFSVEEKKKPLLFDLSKLDYGRIWLKPLRRPIGLSVCGSLRGPGGTDDREDPKAYPDKESKGCLSLKIELISKPDLADMNELAQAMQYLPHVRSMKFESLHMPMLELDRFLVVLNQARRIRPLIAEKKRRRTERQAHEAAAASGQAPNQDAPPQVNSRQQQRASPIYEWEKMKLKHVIRTGVVPDAERTGSPASLDAEMPPGNVPTGP